MAAPFGHNETLVEKKTRLKQQKDAASFSERILKAATKKTTAVRPINFLFTTHLFMTNKKFWGPLKM